MQGGAPATSHRNGDSGVSQSSERQPVLPNEMWDHAISFLAPVEQVRISGVCAAWKSSAVTHLKLKELTAPLSSLLLQAVTANDAALIARCLATYSSNPESTNESESTATKLAEHIESLEQQSQDSTLARHALKARILQNPRVLYAGQTALLPWAIANRKKGMAKIFVECGADVNAQSADGTAAIHVAISDVVADRPFLRFLLDQKGIEKSFNFYSKRLGTPLACACAAGNFPLARQLVEKGASLADPGRGALSPLTHCVEHNQEAFAVELVNGNCDPNKADCKRKRLLPYLAQHKKRWSKLYPLVREKASDVNATDAEGCTALYYRASALDWPEVKELTELGAKAKFANEEVPLLRVALLGAGDEEAQAGAILESPWDELVTQESAPGALRLLVSKDWSRHGEEAKALQLKLCKRILSLNEKVAIEEFLDSLRSATGMGRKDLVVAMLSKQTGLAETVACGAVRWSGAELVFAELLKQGLPVNMKWEGRSLLLHAAEGGNDKLVSFLAEQEGVKLDAVDKDGRTALHLCISERRSIETIRALLSAGARHDVKDKSGYTPLARCVMQEFPDSRVVECLLKTKSDANGCLPDGTPYIHHLAKEDLHDYAQALPYFKKVGLNFAIKDRQGRTLLHICVDQYCKGLFDLIPKDIELLKAQDNKGKTPLHLALDKPYLTISLLEHFRECEGLASVLDIEDANGKTPRQIIQGEDDDPVREKLKEFGCWKEPKKALHSSRRKSGPREQDQDPEENARYFLAVGALDRLLKMGRADLVVQGVESGRELSRKTVETCLKEPKYHETLITCFKHDNRHLNVNDVLEAFNTDQAKFALQLLQVIDKNRQRLDWERDDQGRTVWHHALIHDNEDFVLHRLETGKVNNRPDCDGNRPLHVAITHGRRRAAEAMISKLQAWGSNKADKTPLELLLELHGDKPQWGKCIKALLPSVRANVYYAYPGDKRGPSRVLRMIREKGFVDEAKEVWPQYHPFPEEWQDSSPPPISDPPLSASFTSESLDSSSSAASKSAHVAQTHSSSAVTETATATRKSAAVEEAEPKSPKGWTKRILIVPFAAFAALAGLLFFRALRRSLKP